MRDFVYRNPTEIIFGKGTIAAISSRIPADAVVLFVYGGGSVKKSGVHAQVMTALGSRHVVEFGGIEPNPQYETCVKAITAARAGDVDFVLAVGGGSVMDAGKFIAAALHFKGNDPWEILKVRAANVHSACALGVVVTMPATGSESNGNFVISRADTQEKSLGVSPHVFPKFAVLDPLTTLTLPRKQVRNGIVDSFVHVLEQYVTFPAAAPLQDRWAEGLLQTLSEVGPRTLVDPSDLDARSSFMWCATMALNYLIGAGVPQDWATHRIGVELTALYGLDHAETLAIVLPGVWRYKIEAKRAKLEQYGKRVWGVASAEEAIARTEEFFRSLGMPTRFSEYKLSADDAAEKVAARFTARGLVFGEHQDITPDDVGAILRMRA